MVRKILSVVLLTGVLVLTACGSNPPNRASTDSQSEEEISGIDELKAKAKSGDSKASYQLGTIYDYGLMDESQDYIEAVKYYEMTREQGEPLGSLALGYMYLNGAGVDKDLDVSMDYFKEAMSSGIVESRVGIGLVLMDSDYAGHDDNGAYTQFITAADEGNMDGLYYLSYCRETGRGCQVDPKTAFSGYTEVSESYDPADIRKTNCVNLADTRLGLMYYRGIGTDRDFDEAIDSFSKADNRGFSLAAYYLGVLYETGDGDQEPDYERALSYYESSASRNYAPALNKIGYMYCNGIGVDVDYGQALYFQQLAAAQGYAPAQVNLGYLYENGLGCVRSLETAISYYRMALEGGYEGAGAAIIRVEEALSRESEEYSSP